MNIKEVLLRLEYVRNQANLSARELSLRLGMSEQYFAQVIRGRIMLNVEKLLQILDICNFSVQRFFSKDIDSYVIDNEVEELVNSLSKDKKKNLIELLAIKNKVRFKMSDFFFVLFKIFNLAEGKASVYSYRDMVYKFNPKRV